MSERFLQAASSGETAVVASMLRNPDLDSPGPRTSALVSTVGPEDGQDLSLPPTKGRGRSREDFVPDGI